MTMANGDQQLAQMAKDMRDMLVAQGVTNQRMTSMEATVKETRDDLRTIVNTTLHQMENKITALELRPVYTPLSQQAQADFELWFSRLKEMYTGWSFARWAVPTLLVLISVGVAVATYINH